MKIYLSGQITGLDYTEAFNNFERAENELKAQGMEPVNPMKAFPKDSANSWEEFMVKDIELLFECDAVYFLDNWKRSRGARIEHYIAMETKKYVEFEIVKDGVAV